jgi:uncharacterized OsmC-like protein
MHAADLRVLQAPFKDKYRADPNAAVITLRAEGELGEGLACNVQTGQALVEAGLHPSTGGSGMQACSGDMLLQALVACAGVTMKAVATALGITIKSGHVVAEGKLDVRGTLGVAKEAPVGFREIALQFAVAADATAEQIETLVRLTERYCVVLQTLRASPTLTVSINA